MWGGEQSENANDLIFILLAAGFYLRFRLKLCNVIEVARKAALLRSQRVSGAQIRKTMRHTFKHEITIRTAEDKRVMGWFVF